MSFVDPKDADAVVRLQRLVAKGRAAQAQTVDDLNWDQKTRVPMWLPNRIAAWAVSQFMHGELATASMCQSLANRITCQWGQEFLQTQFLDEMRHAQIYRRYIERINRVQPVNAKLEAAYNEAIAWDGPVEGILLAFHVLLESESLDMQQGVVRWLPCPLFNEISTVIARDEARHIAFGKTWLPLALAGLTPREHRRIYDWLRRMWYDSVGDVAKHLRPFDVVNGPRAWNHWMDQAWAERVSDLREAGLVVHESNLGARVA